MVGSSDYDYGAMRYKVRKVEDDVGNSDVSDIETKLRKLEKLVGKSEYDYGTLLWDVRKLKERPLITQ